ncbi:MAG: acyl-CoA desaturase [Planctomycetes bacterium]|nr:acyl-CoA desaturase [Planctomycetota bacterium]
MKPTLEATRPSGINWLSAVPFTLFHLVPFFALLTGVHWSAWIVMGGLFYIRRWFISAGFHRYFSHRAYKMNRVMQFLMALGGTTAVQQGPLFWASLHRHHHRYSDQPGDAHSPKDGVFWSHIGWVLSGKHSKTKMELVPDLAKFPELRWLDKYWIVPQVALAALVFGLGLLITHTVVGALGFTFIGFFLSTLLVSHSTFTINSLAHLIGRRRYATTDTSRNSLIVTLLTGGEGWHNNHHHYQSSSVQGFRWYEFDTTYYVLWLMSKLRLVHSLNKPPAHVMHNDLVRAGAADLGMFHKHWDRAVKALHSASEATGEIAAVQKQKLDELVVTIKARVDEIAKMHNPAPVPVISSQ